MAYLMLRPLLADVPGDDMCGVTVSQAFPANEKWHPLLLQALSGIPDVHTGDSVWWHCNLIHSVAPVANQQGWGNVMYIPPHPGANAASNTLPASGKPSLPGPAPATSPKNTTSAHGLPERQDPWRGVAGYRGGSPAHRGRARRKCRSRPGRGSPAVSDRAVADLAARDQETVTGNGWHVTRSSHP
jgi:hypothetical protein